MDRPQFTVQDFDELAFLTLKRRPQFSFVRDVVGGAAVYTVSDDAGELGYFAIVPGPRISPQVYLEFSSYAAGIGVGATWFGFRSILDSFKVVDERDEEFRTLCRCIFSEFLMRHSLDKVGRPTKLWEYALQEEAANGNGGQGGDRPPDNIRVPVKPVVLKRWKAIWRKVQGQWDQGRSLKEICSWLTHMHPHLAFSVDILRDIVRAGDAGRLD